MRATVRKKVEYEIVEKIGVINTYTDGKTTFELNLVNWGGNDPKFDLRRWVQSGTGMEIGKGVTFTLDELKTLQGIINGYLEHIS